MLICGYECGGGCCGCFVVLLVWLLLDLLVIDCMIAGSVAGVFYVVL